MLHMVGLESAEIGEAWSAVVQVVVRQVVAHISHDATCQHNITCTWRWTGRNYTARLFQACNTTQTALPWRRDMTKSLPLPLLSVSAHEHTCHHSVSDGPREERPEHGPEDGGEDEAGNRREHQAILVERSLQRKRGVHRCQQHCNFSVLKHLFLSTTHTIAVVSESTTFTVSANVRKRLCVTFEVLLQFVMSAALDERQEFQDDLIKTHFVMLAVEDEVHSDEEGGVWRRR